jgi:type I restriction-modification system DNA methylase subunit
MSRRVHNSTWDVGLPSALFYNTGIPGCVLILNKGKSVALKPRSRHQP